MNHQHLLSGLFASSLIFAACKKSEETAPSTTNVTSVPTTPATPDTVIAKELTGKAHIMKDGEYVETQIKNVDYYLLYFTASW